MFTPGSKYMFFQPEELRTLIETAGIEWTILGSDLGIFDGLKLVQGCRAVIEVLLDLGYSEAEIRLLTTSNAVKLIGLDSKAEG